MVPRQDLIPDAASVMRMRNKRFFYGIFNINACDFWWNRICHHLIIPKFADFCLYHTFDIGAANILKSPVWGFV